MISPSDIILPEALSRHDKINLLGQIMAALNTLSGTPADKVTLVVPIDRGRKAWRLAPVERPEGTRWIASREKSSQIDLPIDFDGPSALVFVMGRTVTTYQRIRVTVLGHIDLARLTLLLTWLRGVKGGIHPLHLGVSNTRTGRLTLRSVLHATPEFEGLFPHDESRQIALGDMIEHASRATGLRIC